MIIYESATTGQFFTSQNILFYLKINPFDVEYSSFLRNIFCPGDFTVILLYFTIDLCRKPVEFCQQHAKNSVS
jgi:hypothetical protein